MTVEKRLSLTDQEIQMVCDLRDRLEKLLKDEDDFIGCVSASMLYDALYDFCEDVL